MMQRWKRWMVSVGVFGALLLCGQVAWAETLTVKGTGQDRYYVYDSAGKELGSRQTNNEIELFPSTYTVKLNGTVQTANVQAGQKAVLVAGLMTTSGTGQDRYYVYDSAGKELGSRQTKNEIELFPGTYTVKLNGTVQTANVQARQKAVLVAGILKIPGTGQDRYYVYDSAGKELGSRQTNNEIELFPGTYTIKLNGSTQTYTVEADAPSTQPTDTTMVTDSTSVIIYKDCEYGGYSINLSPGSYTLSALMSLGMANDDISAIVVPPGLTVTLYQDDNFQGNSWGFTSNNSCFVNTGLNDVVSSIKVSPLIDQPSLGPAQGTGTDGKPVTTTTEMEAGNAVNGQPASKQVTQKLTDTVDIKGNIKTDPADVGQPVDIFVYAAATFPGSSAVSYYMLGPSLTILAWDQQPANLVAFSSGTLGTLQVVSMYSGTFFYPGTLKVYFGYRLPSGTVITSSAPIDITIEP